jgi:hypothetical protein
MTGMGRNLMGGLACLSSLVLYACGSAGVETPVGPVELVFDSTQEAVTGGFRLEPPKSQWDGYGETVAVHGDLLVVGAPEWNYFGPGAVYVYRNMNGEWQQEAQLVAGDRDESKMRAMDGEGQRLGTSVAAGDGIIAAGAPGTIQPADGGYGGAVYLFEYGGGSWRETAMLTPGQVNTEQGGMEWLNYSRMRPRVFGSLVALHGSTLAVAGDAGGTVYIYRRAGEGWQEQAQVIVPGVPGRDLYVTSMSLSGDSLALGAFYPAPQEEEQSLLAGSVAVYVFERRGDAWQESFRFVPDDGRLDYLFEKAFHLGASVALGGGSDRADLLAVGLPGFADWTGDLGEAWAGANPWQLPKYPPSPRQAGEVYLFARSEAGRWSVVATLKPAGWDDPPGPGSFPSVPTHLEEGQEDSIDPNTGLSASIDWSGFVFPGSIFSENPEVTFFGATLDLDGDRLAVTSGFANSTYLFERQEGSWAYRLRLKPLNKKEELWEDPTQPVALHGRTLVLGTPSEFGNSAYVFDLCDPSMLDCR